MTTHTARFEREIAVERALLLANLAELEDRARALADWRRPVRERPLPSVGVALAGGFLLAMLTAPRPRAAAAGSNGAKAPARPHPLVDRFVAAFAVVAAEAAVAALGTLLPSSVDDDEPRHAGSARR